jgi:hypothetical protein
MVHGFGVGVDAVESDLGANWTKKVSDQPRRRLELVREAERALAPM